MHFEQKIRVFIMMFLQYTIFFKLTSGKKNFKVFHKQFFRTKFPVQLCLKVLLEDLCSFGELIFLR